MKIFVIGDIAFTGLLSYEPQKNPNRFLQVSPVLKDAGLVFANLEVPVKVLEEKNEYKEFIHYSLPEPTKELLQLLNISCVSLANNHIYDCKMSGLKTTINILDELGVFHTGAGWKQEHVDPVIINISGIKIGFLAYVSKSTNPTTEHFPEVYVNYFDPTKVIQDIYSLKPKVDKLICSIHWGVDYSYYPTKQQVRIAHDLVNAGADIIMGHHPHTLQPYEIYHNGYIFYSLGGLTFGDYIKDGKANMQALFRKTKISVVISYNVIERNLDYISTKELIGNYIKIIHRDYFRWSSFRWRLHKLKNSLLIFKWLFDFHEKVLYRIYEYFFGYYQNPLKRLFQLSNIRKINRLFKDLYSGH